MLLLCWKSINCFSWNLTSKSLTWCTQPCWLRSPALSCSLFHSQSCHMDLLCSLKMTSTFLIKGLCSWQDLSLNFPSTLFLIIMCQLKRQALREAFPVHPVETDDPLYLFIVLSQHFSCIFHIIRHNLKLILLISSLAFYLSLAREEAP